MSQMHSFSETLAAAVSHPVSCSEFDLKVGTAEVLNDAGCYIEVVTGRMGLPAGIAMTDQRLDALYGNG